MYHTQCIAEPVLASQSNSLSPNNHPVIIGKEKCPQLWGKLISQEQLIFSVTTRLSFKKISTTRQDFMDQCQGVKDQL